MAEESKIVIVSGLAESTSEQGTLTLLNGTLVPALSVTSRFEVIFVGISLTPKLPGILCCHMHITLGAKPSFRIFGSNPLLCLRNRKGGSYWKIFGGGHFEKTGLGG